MEPNKNCDCSLCLRNKKFYEAILRVPEQDKEFWKDIYSCLFHEESDGDYWEAVAKGQWPGWEAAKKVES